MQTSSFVYKFDTVVPGDTRDAVIIDCDFTAVVASPTSKVVLLYLSLSGMRQNSAGSLEGSDEFSARLLGNFNSNNLPSYTISVPRPGDSINQFDGLAFSSSNPFIPSNDTPVLIPPLFQIEFFPSNAKGATPNDILEMFVTIGFRVVL